MDASVLWLNGPQLLAVIGGYLLGSIPFGLILSRLSGYGDLRAIGSGNIGATNVLRTGNRGLALATLLLDGGKGAVATLLAARCDDQAAMIAAVASVLGHDFPVWLAFRGGKGIATSLGALLALAWPVGLLISLVWLAIAILFRYSSVAALASLAAAPPLMLWLADLRYAIAATVLALLGFARHYTNMLRLWRGEEPKIGSRQSSLE